MSTQNHFFFIVSNVNKKYLIGFNICIVVVMVIKWRLFLKATIIKRVCKKIYSNNFGAQKFWI